jgi:5-methylcytosine-specific restriction endonuclease McrA
MLLVRIEIMERTELYLTGIYRLHRLALQEGDKMQDVFHWLKTGELTVDVWKNQVDNAKEEQLVKRRAAAMHSRMIKLRNHANQGLATGLPTSDALYDLYINSECKCAVTGWTCHFSKFTEQKYWSVTFDHIVPVSQAQGMNPWSIANIQVMCHILNNVKGDYPDEELRRWFGLWKDART